jgi:hypothetical protein
MLPAATMFAFGKRCAFGSDIAFAVILSSTVILPCDSDIALQ